MPGDTESTSSSNTGETDIPANTKRVATAARGYIFQDFVAGACILSVFFEESEAVSIEWKIDDDDKFDDIILEQNGETTCIQVKNGPEHTLSSGDLSGSSSRGLDLGELTNSV